VRLTIQKKEPDQVTMKIEGKVVGQQVHELRGAWRELAPTLGEKKLCVDVCGVTFADRNAKHLLAEIYEKTCAEFIADTPLTKYFAEQAQLGPRFNTSTEFDPDSI